MNRNVIPDYIKVAKLFVLSKTKRSEVSLDQIRPIAVQSHILKVLEKAIKNKLFTTKSKLLEIKDYQTGFVAGVSTHLNKIVSHRRKKSKREIYISFDISKAYDCVNRAKLVQVLRSR